MTNKNLIDDCFLHAPASVAHDDAIALLRARLSPIADVEDVTLGHALGRVIASPVVAVLPVPAHTNAAVDGYAFAHAAYAATSGATLEIAGRAAAGRPLDTPIDPSRAVRILTGAVMPAGLDTTVMQEDVELTTLDGRPAVRIPGGLRQGANVRKAGEDVRPGTVLFSPGHVIRPQDLAALASIGRASVACRKPLEVAIVSTGDEVVRPGSGPLAPGQVFDANAPMFDALTRLAGANATSLGIWPDDPAEVRQRLVAAAERFDVILTSGGASRGEEDHMAAAIGALGTRHFWQIKVKPGRPMMFGQIGRSIIVGLPGNPVAVFVCFLMYVHPILRRLGGAEWTEPRRYALPARFSFEGRKLGRREFWRGILVETPDGLAVDKYARDGSGLISGLRAADGLIDVGEDVPHVRPGDLVSFIPFSEFGIVGR